MLIWWSHAVNLWFLLKILVKRIANIIFTLFLKTVIKQETKAIDLEIIISIITSEYYIICRVENKK